MTSMSFILVVHKMHTFLKHGVFKGQTKCALMYVMKTNHLEI
ncbi:hypothetical protein HanXRQr2_Chr15g0672721 [Helianthus annuus]|uniref:Uncharacterized protein n=1 Tax=Helianthus annuus TaxID=4232 RepID=A0A9K3H1B0_HELAN|nr:hypothetical protein HanXRQr2_Chr15g0672721 [Helianthus annuus]